MTHWKALTESEVIRFADLGTREATVRITKVVRENVTGAGAKVSVKPTIYIEGKSKPIVGNSSICKAISSMYGPHIEAWPGKLITIYGDPTVTFGGDVTGGIRVKPIIPKEQAKQPVMETTDVPPSEVKP